MLMLKLHSASLSDLLAMSRDIVAVVRCVLHYTQVYSLHSSPSYSSSDSSQVPDAHTPTQPHPIDKGATLINIMVISYGLSFCSKLTVLRFVCSLASSDPPTPPVSSVISGERLLLVAVECGGVGVCLCDGDGEVVRADVTGLSTTVQLFSDNTWISAR